MLAVDEIQSLNLNAELVVLSSDDTARGQITGDVDNSTADLMLEFYRQFQQNPNPAQALRQAMLVIRENYPHPRD